MNTDKAPATDSDRKVPEAWREDNDTKSDLKTLLRPTLIAMTLVGGYNFENLQIDSIKTESSKQRWKRSFFIYRLVLLSAILFYISNTVARISQLDSMVHVVICTWMLLCLVLYILFWRASSEKFGTLNTAFTTWDKTVLPQFRELDITFPNKQVRKTRYNLMVLGIVLIMMNSLCLIVQFVLIEDKGNYTYPLPANGFTIAVNVTCNALCTVIYVIPNIFVAMVAYTLKQAFALVSTAMQRSLKAQSCKMPPHFQKLRILHMDLCTLVSEFDTDFGWYYTTLFVWQVGLACFNLYLLVRTESDTFVTVIIVFWAVGNLAILGFASVFAAMMNQEAHAPLDGIYYINVSDVDLEKLAQMNLFLSKLTGTQIGFSTCGLLIITKEFISTIVGAFLTYFAVLYTL